MSSPSLPYAGSSLVTTQSASAVTAATIPSSVFTTEYYFTAEAADSASAWLATYTIREVVGPGADQQQQQAAAAAATSSSSLSIPPGFVATAVTCDACATPVQTITCPVDAADRTGAASSVISIWGNGVTATPGASATAAAAGGDDNTQGIWWAGALLTQSGSPTGHYGLSSPSGYVTTGDAAALWGNLALVSGAFAVAVGWLLWWQ